MVEGRYQERRISDFRLLEKSEQMNSMVQASSLKDVLHEFRRPVSSSGLPRTNSAMALRPKPLTIRQRASSKLGLLWNQTRQKANSSSDIPARLSRQDSSESNSGSSVGSGSSSKHSDNGLGLKTVNELEHVFSDRFKFLSALELEKRFGRKRKIKIKYEQWLVKAFFGHAKPKVRSNLEYKALTTGSALLDFLQMKIGNKDTLGVLSDKMSPETQGRFLHGVSKLLNSLSAFCTISKLKRKSRSEKLEYLNQISLWRIYYYFILCLVEVQGNSEERSPKVIFEEFQTLVFHLIDTHLNPDSFIDYVEGLRNCVDLIFPTENLISPQVVKLLWPLGMARLKTHLKTITDSLKVGIDDLNLTVSRFKANMESTDLLEFTEQDLSNVARLGDVTNQALKALRVNVGKLVDGSFNLLGELVLN